MELQTRRHNYLPKKRDAFTAIKRFMCDEGAKLKVEEEQILNRWIFCDALLRAKEDDEAAIIKKIVDAFHVSKFTALNDINNAQKLFADSRKLNKRYLIHIHLQRIDDDIQKIRKQLFKVEIKDDKTIEYVPDAKEMASLAKLLEAYTYTLNSIPDDVQSDKKPPPIFQFVLAPGQVIEKPMDLSDAMEKADAILLTQQKDGSFSVNEEDDE